MFDGDASAIIDRALKPPVVIIGGTGLGAPATEPTALPGMNLGLFLATTVLACSFAFVVLVYAFQSLYGFIKLPSRAKRVSGTQPISLPQSTAMHR